MVSARSENTMAEGKTMAEVVDLQGLSRALGISDGLAYAMVAVDDFPQPVKLTNRKYAHKYWILEEVRAWILARPRVPVQGKFIRIGNVGPYSAVPPGEGAGLISSPPPRPHRRKASTTATKGA
jgi:predicted DNA-binding transcriptional regulator AlpA